MMKKIYWKEYSDKIKENNLENKPIKFSLDKYSKVFLNKSSK